MSFLSTLSLRRATVPYHERSGAQCFSIHALLAESDWWRITALWPNTPFLSTLSLRRATATNTRARHLMTFFYPRSPCGERLDDVDGGDLVHFFLSTLSLRRATHAIFVPAKRANFLSTLSLRRATAAGDCTAEPAGFLSTLSLRRATSAN